MVGKWEVKEGGRSDNSPTYKKGERVSIAHSSVCMM